MSKTAAIDIPCDVHGARAGEWCHKYRRICRTRIHTAGMVTRVLNRDAIRARRDRLLATAKERE